MLLRRDFIKGCAAAALANPLFASLRADAMTIVGIVDAHCHIFNGDDLPIVQFIEKVALPKQSEFKQYVTEYGHVIRFTVPWIRCSVKCSVTRICIILSGGTMKSVCV
jgi:hypothetical protein